MHFVNQAEVLMWAILGVFKTYRDRALTTNRCC